MSASIAFGLALAAALSLSGDEDGLRAELQRLRDERVSLLARVEELERSLSREMDVRESREREWLAWMQLIDSLELAEAPEPPPFLVDMMEAALADREARYSAARTRSLTMQAELQALLMAEQILDFDVLEVGTLNFDEPPGHAESVGKVATSARSGWLGPVVVRLLDLRGRTTGMLASQRLRMECSRAGYSVTLVFEEGRESRGGVSRPFGEPLSEDGQRGGVRRVHFSGVNPRPWIEAFPELFDPEDRRALPDDGLWNRLDVRLELNHRLAVDPLGERFRLLDLGGVVDGVMHGIQVVELDGDGRPVRRLFADRMRIQKSEGGVQMVLEKGVQERDDVRAPFLEGRYRIYLGGADTQAWIEAPLPGLAPPPGQPRGRDDSSSSESVDSLPDDS